MKKSSMGNYKKRLLLILLVLTMELRILLHKKRNYLKKKFFHILVKDTISKSIHLMS
jgi:hypothetical protein